MAISPKRLNKRFFFEKMKEMKAAYPAWEFDTRNSKALEVWFQQSSYLSDTEFGKLAEWYISHKNYPPRSVFEFVQSYREIFRSQYPTGDEMEGMLLKWVQKYGEDRYRTAMRHCPPLIEKIPISYYDWINLCADYDEIEKLAKRYLALVDDEIEKKCQMLKCGVIGLPLTESGQLISYENEENGIRSDEGISNGEKIKALEMFREDGKT